MGDGDEIEEWWRWGKNVLFVVCDVRGEWLSEGSEIQVRAKIDIKSFCSRAGLTEDSYPQRIGSHSYNQRWNYADRHPIIFQVSSVQLKRC